MEARHEQIQGKNADALISAKPSQNSHFVLSSGSLPFAGADHISFGKYAERCRERILAPTETLAAAFSTEGIALSGDNAIVDWGQIDNCPRQTREVPHRIGAPSPSPQVLPHVALSLHIDRHVCDTRDLGPGLRKQQRSGKPSGQ